MENKQRTDWISLIYVHLYHYFDYVIFILYWLPSAACLSCFVWLGSPNNGLSLSLDWFVDFSWSDETWCGGPGVALNCPLCKPWGQVTWAGETAGLCCTGCPSLWPFPWGWTWPPLWVWPCVGWTGALGILAWGPETQCGETLCSWGWIYKPKKNKTLKVWLKYYDKHFCFG